MVHSSFGVLLDESFRLPRFRPRQLNPDTYVRILAIRRRRAIVQKKNIFEIENDQSALIEINKVSAPL